MSSFRVPRTEGINRNFSAGQTIFSAGEAGDYMYVIASGDLEVWLGERMIEQIGEGGIVGEMALVDRQPRSATVIAKTDCELIAVDRERFQRMVQLTPFFAIHVMQILTERLRRQMARE